jgi:hypothetical protein
MPSWTVRIFFRAPCSPNSKLPCFKIVFIYFSNSNHCFSKKVIAIIRNFVNCRYVDHVLTSERDNMKCCKIEYKYPVHSSQTYIYGGILIAGFIVYFVVIFFSSPVRWHKIMKPTNKHCHTRQSISLLYQYKKKV